MKAAIERKMEEEKVEEDVKLIGKLTADKPKKKKKAKDKEGKKRKRKGKETKDHCTFVGLLPCPGGKAHRAKIKELWDKFSAWVG